jgi:hypothetical protein
VRVSEREADVSYLFWSLACLTIEGADLSATLISETCDKSFDSSLNTNIACPYMLFSNCECCSTCGPNNQAIQLEGCSFVIKLSFFLFNT